MLQPISTCQNVTNVQVKGHLSDRLRARSFSACAGLPKATGHQVEEGSNRPELWCRAAQRAGNWYITLALAGLVAGMRWHPSVGLSRIGRSVWVRSGLHGRLGPCHRLTQRPAEDRTRHPRHCLVEARAWTDTPHLPSRPG